MCVECVWVQEEVRRQWEEGDYKSLKLSRFAWKALRPVICSMLPCSKKKNKNKKKQHKKEWVPPPAQLICMCMAQRTIAELWACQLQRSAQSAYCLVLQMSPQPSCAICRFLKVGVGQGRAGRSRGLLSFQCQRGQPGWVWPVWAGCGLGEGSRVSSGVLPAAVGTIIYSHALSETLVNRPQRREISYVWVQQQQQQQPPALHLNNEICVTHQFFFQHFYLVFHEQ